MPFTHAARSRSNRPPAADPAARSSASANSAAGPVGLAQDWMNRGARGRAFAQIAATVQRNSRGGGGTDLSGGGVVQRVGGETTGYDPATITKPEFAANVKALFRVARRLNQLRKRLATNANLDALKPLTTEKERGQQVKGPYAWELSQITLDVTWLTKVLGNHDVPQLVQKAKAAGLLDDEGEKDITDTIAAISPRLQIAGNQIVDASWKAADGGTQPKVDILRGEAAYAEVATANPAGGIYRSTYKKLGKEGGREYVKDDFGVYTRRMAYMEKSYHQVMAYQESKVLTGKTQELMSAATGKKAADIDPLAFGDQHLTKDEQALIDQQPGKAATRPDKLKALAYMHQWKGSGPGQRGLSLTSTPKDDAVFGNAGDSFRTDDGAKFEIDLARVNPADNILINHYSAASATRTALGTRSGHTASNRKLKGAKAKGPVKTYPYERSVLKNREIYLQKATDKEITRITPHGTGANLAKDSALFLAEKSSAETTPPADRVTAVEAKLKTAQDALVVPLANLTEARDARIKAVRLAHLAASRLLTPDLPPDEAIVWKQTHSALVADAAQHLAVEQRLTETVEKLEDEIAQLTTQLDALRSTHTERAWQARVSYAEGYKAGVAAKAVGTTDKARVDKVVDAAYKDKTKHAPYWKGYGAGLRS